MKGISKKKKKYKTNPKIQKIKKINLNFFLTKKGYILSFPILGGRNSTRALQSSLFQKYKNLEKSQKITFFQQQKKVGEKIAEKRRKKCYPLSFLILGGRNLTRALQSSQFQNPGGVPWAWHSSRSSSMVLLLSNLGLVFLLGPSKMV